MNVKFEALNLNQELDISDQNCALKSGVYFSNNGKCYVRSSEKTDKWDDAKARCKEDGGVLATIANQATHDFFVRYFDGATMMGAERKGNWSWNDGTPWTGFANWGNNEPNEGDNTFLMINGKKWWDVKKSGSYSYYYLCQY